MSTISASTTSTTAYKVTADTTGTLVLQTGSTPTTAVTIGTDQSVTLASALTIGSATQSVPSGTAPLYSSRAWVNFNGTGTVAIRSSGNVTSITDNGTGDYTVNFTTAMPDANYSLVGTTSSDSVAITMIYVNGSNTALTTTTARLQVANISTTAVDRSYVGVAVFR